MDEGAGDGFVSFIVGMIIGAVATILLGASRYTSDAVIMLGGEFLIGSKVYQCSVTKELKPPGPASLATSPGDAGLVRLKAGELKK